MSKVTVTNPYDGSIVAEVAKQSATEVDQALASAYRLFNDRENWLPAYQRIAILEKTVEIMSSQVEELTRLAASEGGKPYADSEVEVLRAIQGVKLAINIFRK